MGKSAMIMSMSMLSIMGCFCVAILAFILIKSKGGVVGTGGLGLPGVGSCLEAQSGAQVPGFEYTTRSQDPQGVWRCPVGYSDTGCDWVPHGNTVGKMQCRKVQAPAQPGPWESPWYGTKKHEVRKFSCPTGKNITGAVLFGGEDNNAQTNAIAAVCSLPDFSGGSNALDNGKPTCGKRDFPHAATIVRDSIKSVGQLFGPVDQLLSSGFGRKLWTQYTLATPSGITGWEVIPGEGSGCPKSGLCGLNLISAEGQHSGWAGGQSDRVNKGNKQVGTCPPGKIVKEIRTTCGDRVDGIQFMCDVP